jgi:hypothetical protein
VIFAPPSPAGGGSPRCGGVGKRWRRCKRYRFMLETKHGHERRSRDGPHPRADLLASNGVRAAAIEAKGLDGNAREANFRQVERWKAEVNSAQTLPEDERASDPDLRRYAEKLGFLGEFSDEPGNCKGLMVIGTFRNTLLDKRNLPDFPDNVARLLAQAGVCGLSGLQLCGLVLMARQDPTIKEKIVDTMYSTSGVLKMALNWREFLKETEQE